MRSVAKRVGIGAGSLLGALLLVLLLLLLGANTGPGRALVTALVPRFTDGTVQVAGLSGTLPGHIRVQRLVLSDASGPWLTARNVVLDWRPLRLLGGTIFVDRLTAPEAHLLRLPAEQTENAAPSPARPAKPMPLIVHELDVQRLRISPALAGHVLDLAVTASGERTNAGVAALKIDAHALTGGGRYRIDARLTPDRVALTTHLGEPANGLLAGLAGLSLPGPIRLDANLSGPRSEVAAKIAAMAGPLVAGASGRIDLAARSASLSISASAPPMQPRAGIAWRGVTLNARLDGPFTSPNLAGNLDVTGLSAAGANISRITASLAGSGGLAHLEAKLSGVVLPGPAPDLLAEAPLLLDASAKLDAPGRPVSFTLRHPLIIVDGTAETAGAPTLVATIDLPDLTPLAAIAGLGTSGGASIKLSANKQPSGFALSLSSALALKAAPAPLLSLLGAAPRISLAVGLRNDTVTLSHLSLLGHAFSLHAHGDLSDGKIALAWQAALSDLAPLDAGLSGRIAATGTLEGRTDRMALAAQLGGTLGTATRPSQPFRASLAATGLPAAPSGSLVAETDLDGAPLGLALKATEDAGHTVVVTIEQAHWKGAHAQGALTFGAGTLPTGHLTFAAGNLGDFSSLIGPAFGGSADGSLTSESTPSGPRLLLDLRGASLAAAGVAIAKAHITATLDHPLGDRRFDSTLRLDGLSAGGVTATASMSAEGPFDALALRLNAASASFGATSLSAAALVNATAGDASLSALAADWHGEAARLLAPARIVFSPGVSIEGLRLGMAGAELDASGRISPNLAATLQLRNVSSALLAPFMPGLAFKGRLDAEAKLAGALVAPTGTLQLHGSNLGLSSGLTAGLPPANLDLTAALAGHTAHIRGALSAGSATRLTLSGTLPLASNGALGLSVAGDADLALLEPALAAGGRHIAGRLALDATARGTLASPVIAGTARLSGGMITDYQSGFALTAMAANIAIADGRIQIQDFHARAGPGTISLAGSIGALEPGVPVSLTVSAENAELLQSDLITARLDSHLVLTGLAERELSARGRVDIRRAEMQIPNSLPPDVAVLHVVRPGNKPAPSRADVPAIALDVTLEATRQIFIRGRGVDAEFGGRIHVSGTLSTPAPEGSFHLIRGQLSLAGQTLAFTSGTIGFNGGDLTDPSLDLVATTASRTTTATLTLSGTAQKPKVTLSSVPELPQDQVLAALLFGTSATSLSPFQLAEIASALASLTGAGPSIGDPLGTLRKGLGLDQLSVGSDASGNAAVQAGRYIAPGVYLGASQSAAGGGAQAQVKIDLTKHLQLNATVGNGAGSATAIGSATEPNTRNGSSVGLTYQFQY